MSIVCFVLAGLLLLTTLLGIGLATLGIGFAGAVLAVLSAVGVIVFGAGGFFVRRRSRAWWLVLNTFFALGVAGGIFELLRGEPVAILGSAVCAACLFLLVAPGRCRAYFDAAG